tara:strand:- start:135 stop:1586 length:1452 start_codon:yes stop_codon:yes gene_type:complete
MPQTVRALIEALAYDEKIETFKEYGYGVEGSTFLVKDQIKELGGIWDYTDKVWWMPDEMSQATVLSLVKEQELKAWAVGSGSGPTGMSGGGQTPPPKPPPKKPSSVTFGKAIVDLTDVIPDGSWPKMSGVPGDSWTKISHENGVGLALGGGEVAIYNPTKDQWYSEDASPGEKDEIVAKAYTLGFAGGWQNVDSTLFTGGVDGAKNAGKHTTPAPYKPPTDQEKKDSVVNAIKSHPDVKAAGAAAKEWVEYGLTKSTSSPIAAEDALSIVIENPGVWTSSSVTKPDFANTIRRNPETEVGSLVGPEQGGNRQVAIHLPGAGWLSGSMNAEQFNKHKAKLKDRGVTEVEKPKPAPAPAAAPTPAYVPKTEPKAPQASSVGGATDFPTEPAISTGKYKPKSTIATASTLAKKSFPEFFREAGYSFDPKESAKAPTKQMLQVVAAMSPVWGEVFGEPPPNKSQLTKMNRGEVGDVLTAIAVIAGKY